MASPGAPSPTKEGERGSRFSNPLGLRKGSEALVDSRLREELSEKALGLCKPQMGAFAACAKKWNMAVIFMCREENNAMNACLSSYTNDEELAKYKAEKQAAGMLDP